MCWPTFRAFVDASVSQDLLYMYSRVAKLPPVLLKKLVAADSSACQHTGIERMTQQCLKPKSEGVNSVMCEAFDQQK